MKQVRKSIVIIHIMLLLFIFVDNLGANYRLKAYFFEKDNPHVFNVVCKTIFCEYSLSNNIHGDIIRADAIVVKVLFTNVLFVTNMDFNDKVLNRFYYKGIDLHPGRAISTITYKLKSNHQLFVIIDTEYILAFGAIYSGRLSTFDFIQKYIEIPVSVS